MSSADDLAMDLARAADRVGGVIEACDGVLAQPLLNDLGMVVKTLDAVRGELHGVAPAVEAENVVIKGKLDPDELLFVHYDSDPAVVTVSEMEAQEALTGCKERAPDLPWTLSRGVSAFYRRARRWNEENR